MIFNMKLNSVNKKFIFKGISNVTKVCQRNGILQDHVSNINKKKRKRKHRPKKSTRKRQREPDNWIDTKAKKARISGSDGLGRKDKVIKAKEIGDGCGGKCSLKCQSKLNMADRQLAFRLFRNIEDR